MTAWHEARDIAAALGHDAPTRVLAAPLARAASDGGRSGAAAEEEAS